MTTAHTICGCGARLTATLPHDPRVASRLAAFVVRWLATAHGWAVSPGDAVCAACRARSTGAAYCAEGRAR